MSKRLAQQINTLSETLNGVLFDATTGQTLFREADATLSVLENAWGKSIKELKPWTSHLVIGDMIAEVIQVRLAARERRKAARKAQERQYFTLEARAQLR